MCRRANGLSEGHEVSIDILGGMVVGSLGGLLTRVLSHFCSWVPKSRMLPVSMFKACLLGHILEKGDGGTTLEGNGKLSDLQISPTGKSYATV